MQKWWWAWLVVVVMLAGVVASAQGPATSPTEHKALAPSDIPWGEPPPVLNQSAKFAVLAGDPNKEGQFIVRLKMPAGYKVMPHWHPKDEHVTVLSGSFAIGMGDTMDTKAKAFPAGSFFSMPARMHHFAFAKSESVVDISGMGPFQITYVNPADDPSKQRATAR